jgi:hypothetical protein
MPIDANIISGPASATTAETDAASVLTWHHRVLSFDGFILVSWFVFQKGSGHSLHAGMMQHHLNSGFSSSGPSMPTLSVGQHQQQQQKQTQPRY